MCYKLSLSSILLLQSNLQLVCGGRLIDHRVAVYIHRTDTIVTIEVVMPIVHKTIQFVYIYYCLIYLHERIINKHWMHRTLAMTRNVNLLL